uniref:X-box binding protein 1 n=1 Tax=Cynoglossus semilaevis TaxID=244447 RepID=A0A3P8VCE1_CYNSE
AHINGESCVSCGTDGNWATVGQRQRRRGGRLVRRKREKNRNRSVGLKFGTLIVGTMTGKSTELNQKLHIENRLLREKTSGLLTENEELRQKLGLDTLDSKEKVQVLLPTGNDAGLGVGSSESAALRLCVPPQQVQAQQSLNQKTSQWIQMVLTIQAMSLICSWAFWTSLTQSCSSSLVSRSARSSRCCRSEWGTQYLPPHLRLWGAHQLSWRPLMN